MAMAASSTVSAPQSLAFDIDQVPAWQPRRKILGMSAILLPFADNGDVDWTGFRGHVTRTLDAGLVPAVNMDTGYANLIDEATRVAVLKATQELAAGRMYVAGAFVGDAPGASFARDTYLQQIASIQEHGGTPVIFQSFGLTGKPIQSSLSLMLSWGGIPTSLLALSWAPCSRPSARSIRWTSIVSGSPFHNAWGPSIVRLIANRSGSGWQSATNCVPSSMC